MSMSFIEKIFTIFKYIGSSFLSIELFVLSLLLFLLLIVNVRYNNKYANYIIVLIYSIFLITIIITAPTYIGYSFDSFIKKVMNYIYFPSTIVYFFIMVFSILVILYSMFSRVYLFLRKYLIMQYLILCFFSF